MTELGGIAGHIELFKDWKHAVHGERSKFRNDPNRIFLYVDDCELGESSITVESINRFFRDPNFHNERSVLQRMLIDMQFLQEMFIEGDFQKGSRPYRYADQEYPQRYIALVKGLDVETIQAMANLDMGDWRRHMDQEKQNSFVDQLLMDKLSMAQIPDPIIPRNEEAERKYGHLGTAAL